MFSLFRVLHFKVILGLRNWCACGRHPATVLRSRIAGLRGNDHAIGSRVRAVAGPLGCQHSNVPSFLHIALHRDELAVDGRFAGDRCLA